MKQDSYVCSTLTPNIINEYDYDYDYDMIMITAGYVYGIVYVVYSLCIMLRIKCYIIDDLGTPQSSDEGTCHEWLMFRS